VRSQNGVPLDVCLGPGDLLEITVFHWEEMRGLKARVSSTGYISLPLLGEMRAAGLTENELQDQIAARLRNGFMKDPQVTVFTTRHRSQQVSVTGAVARPGLYGLSRDRRTVLDLISEAGGLTDNSGGKVLFHATGNAACGATESTKPPTPIALTPIEIDLNKDYDPPTANPLNLPVYGGDSIVISRGRFLVDGWVEKPGAYDLSPGITAFGALTAAGGAMFPAKLTEVVIWRSSRSGAKTRIDLDLEKIAAGQEQDMTLEVGDVISVPASAVKMVPYSAYWFIKNVLSIGQAAVFAGV